MYISIYTYKCCQLLWQFTDVTTALIRECLKRSRYGSFSLDPLDYCQTHTAKTALRKAALGEGLPYRLIPSSVLFFPF